MPNILNENQLLKQKTKTMPKDIKQQCPEFPYFGARYPDACCIDGFLWDLDSCEGEFLTHGGDEPCPFCNQDAYINAHEDNDPENPVLKRDIIKWIENMREKYDNKITSNLLLLTKQ